MRGTSQSLGAPARGNQQVQQAQPTDVPSAGPEHISNSKQAAPPLQHGSGKSAYNGSPVAFQVRPPAKQLPIFTQELAATDSSSAPAAVGPTPSTLPSSLFTFQPGAAPAAAGAAANMLSAAAPVPRVLVRPPVETAVQTAAAGRQVCSAAATGKAEQIERIRQLQVLKLHQKVQQGQQQQMWWQQQLATDTTAQVDQQLQPQHRSSVRSGVSEVAQQLQISLPAPATDLSSNSTRGARKPLRLRAITPAVAPSQAAVTTPAAGAATQPVPQQQRRQQQQQLLCAGTPQPLAVIGMESSEGDRQRQQRQLQQEWQWRLAHTGQVLSIRQHVPAGGAGASNLNIGQQAAAAAELNNAAAVGADMLPPQQLAATGTGVAAAAGIRAAAHSTAPPVASRPVELAPAAAGGSLSATTFTTSSNRKRSRSDVRSSLAVLMAEAAAQPPAEPSVFDTPTAMPAAAAAAAAHPSGPSSTGSARLATAAAAGGLGLALSRQLTPTAAAAAAVAAAAAESLGPDWSTGTASADRGISSATAAAAAAGLFGVDYDPHSASSQRFQQQQMDRLQQLRNKRAEDLTEEERREKTRLSNREAARKLRQRKVALVSTLQEELTHTRAENKDLLAQLDTLAQTARATQAENMALKAEAARLRAALAVAKSSAAAVASVTGLGAGLTATATAAAAAALPGRQRLGVQAIQPLFQHEGDIGHLLGVQGLGHIDHIAAAAAAAALPSARYGRDLASYLQLQQQEDYLMDPEAGAALGGSLHDLTRSYVHTPAAVASTRPVAAASATVSTADPSTAVGSYQALLLEADHQQQQQQQTEQAISTVHQHQQQQKQLAAEQQRQHEVIQQQLLHQAQQLLPGTQQRLPEIHAAAAAAAAEGGGSLRVHRALSDDGTLVGRPHTTTTAAAAAAAAAPAPTASIDKGRRWSEGAPPAVAAVDFGPRSHPETGVSIGAQTTHISSGQLPQQHVLYQELTAAAAGAQASVTRVKAAAEAPMGVLPEPHVVSCTSISPAGLPITALSIPGTTTTVIQPSSFNPLAAQTPRWLFSSSFMDPAIHTPADHQQAATTVAAGQVPQQQLVASGLGVGGLPAAQVVSTLVRPPGGCTAGLHLASAGIAAGLAAGMQLEQHTVFEVSREVPLQHMKTRMQPDHAAAAAVRSTADGHRTRDVTVETAAVSAVYSNQTMQQLQQQQQQQDWVSVDDLQGSAALLALHEAAAAAAVAENRSMQQQQQQQQQQAEDMED